MSPIRARKAIPLGKFIRVNITARSIARALRGQGAPWSSISIGPRGFTWNSRRRTARVNLPGPFSYETPRLDRQLEDDDAAGYVTDDEAELQPCDLCSAQPGEPCHTLRDGRPTKPHAARLARARDAITYQTDPTGDDRP